MPYRPTMCIPFKLIIREAQEISVVRRVDTKLLNINFFSGCQCSVEKKCAQLGLLCNCDMNDDVWCTDSGFFTEKFRLPLTEVRVGDTGSRDEMLRYNVGPLRCSIDE